MPLLNRGVDVRAAIVKNRVSMRRTRLKRNGAPQVTVPSSRFPEFSLIRVGVGATKKCYLSSILHGYQRTTQAYCDVVLYVIIL